MPRLPTLLACFLTLTSPVAAQSPEKIEFFESKVRPLLVTRCGACHADKVKMGGMDLITRDGMHVAGVVVPGDIESSRLVKALRYEGEVKMPPTGKLDDKDIEAFERWIAEGAVWPETTAASAPVDAGGYWAFQPVRKPEPPQVRDETWPREAIDRFILAKLEQKNLAPVRDADKYTLLRRVTLDVTGLLPTPQDIEAFVNDTSAQAFERVVDRLLASPEFGDRWGRHWLDITYYADTTGVGRRIPLKNAWRYRDYVINAFNRDKPFNRFIQEQIAGPEEGRRRNANPSPRTMAATGFLVIGPWAWFNMDREQLRMDVADLQLDLVGRTFLGLTVGCARCHDHKFDPISHSDYYAMAGIFLSTRTTTRDNMTGGLNTIALPETVDGVQQYAKDLVEWDKHVKEIEAADKEYAKQQEELEKQLKELTAADKTEQVEVQLQDLKKQHEEVRKKRGSAPDRQILPFTQYMRPELPRVYAAEDMDFPEDAHIAIRGDINQPGDLVPRGFLKAASYGDPPEIGPHHSGRKQLAEWIANEKNPLTARVYVNRLWHHLFGAGIVATTDNFGSRGEPPTHPELLDYLAARLVENGWSTKKTIREMVLSRAYQVASLQDPKASEVDPDNKLLWRANRPRYEVEVIRDTMAQIAGDLDLRRGGPTLPLTAQNLHTIAPYFLEEDTLIQDHVKHRRMVYQPIMRGGQMADVDILNLFDFADPDQVVGTRSATTVPTQMLYLLNAPFVKEQSRNLAKHLLADATLDDAGRVKTIILAALNRPATDRDLQQARQFLSDFEPQLEKLKNEPENPELDAWARYCHAVFVSSEFLYRR